MRFNLVYGFYSIVVIVCLYVATSQFSKTTIAGLSKRASHTRESFFKHSFLSILDERKNILNLESDNLVDSPRSRNVTLTNPRGSLGDNEKIFFESKEGVVYREKNTLFLNTSARLFNDVGVTTSNEMELNYKTNELVGRGEVNSFFKNGPSKLLILASRFKAKNNLQNSIQFFGNVRGSHQSTEQKNDKIKFKSNLLTYSETDKTISLEVNAVITRALTHIHALNGKIWLNNQSDGVKYFAMNDDVRITDEFINSIGKRIKRFSYSERVEGFNGDRKLILSGFPQVKQEGDIIKGNKMVIREDQEVIEVINTNSQFNMKNEN